MNGELLIKGYKFSNDLLLNIQDKTVLTGKDTYTVFELFNMLENYFNRKNFSDYYLEKGTTLILNGNKLSGSEFVVFRLRPTIYLSEELKITKKSIMGQAIQSVFVNENNNMDQLMATIESDVLYSLNTLTENYGISFSYESPDIFTIAKILVPVVKETSGQEVLPQEHDQFFCKAMLLNFISRLKTDKKKMVLIEFPEYGLQTEKVAELFGLLSTTIFDIVVIYTLNNGVIEAIPRIFNYHVARKGGVYGFDDYDKLEKELQEFYESSAEELEHKVLEAIFSFNDRYEEGEVLRDLLDCFFDAEK